MTCVHSVLDYVIAEARRAAPAECCGVLLGTADRIGEAVRARNLSADPNRFVVDPRDHIAARRRGRTAGTDVIGFYHSHPHSEATPSPTDIAALTYDGCVYLIVSLVGTPPVRLFRMGADRARELEMTMAAA